MFTHTLVELINYIPDQNLIYSDSAQRFASSNPDPTLTPKLTITNKDNLPCFFLHTLKNL